MIEKKEQLQKDYKIIQKYLNMRYPKYTHYLELDFNFDYINGLCTRFLKNPKKDLGFKLCGLSEDEIKKINNYLSLNNDENESYYLLEYYEKTCEAINILEKYYDFNGRVKK